MLRISIVTAATACLTLGVSGCATVQVRPHRELVYAPTQNIEILEQEPARAYVVLAELSYKDSNNAILRLTEKAEEIGAHAIILLGEQVESGQAVLIPVGQMMVATAKDKVRVVALAIRYEPEG